MISTGVVEVAARAQGTGRADPEVDHAPTILICLEDGRKFKSLKRHLRTKYDMSPEDYRAKWGLAKDYPMVAPNYAKARSDLAKQMAWARAAATRPRRHRPRQEVVTG